MFYVSKWPGLEIGNSFNLDKHHYFPSSVTSFAHERKGRRSFLLTHPWVDPEPLNVAS